MVKVLDETNPMSLATVASTVACHRTRELRIFRSRTELGAWYDGRYSRLRPYRQSLKSLFIGFDLLINSCELCVFGNDF